jgi:hypothetical protein
MLNEATLSVLLLVLVIGWFWLDSLRAREMAIGIARRTCSTRGLQLLDQTVALQRIRPRWAIQGLRFHRIYRFEVSCEGFDRCTAQLALLGIELQWIDVRQPHSTLESSRVTVHGAPGAPDVFRSDGHQ